MAAIVKTSPIIDARGNPIRKEVLTQAIAGPTITGVRSPLSGYPGDGLDPRRLAAILREADAGDPLRYYELAEVMEERDLHYAGVLGTRKRSVAQLGITVEPGGDTPLDQEIATRVENWLTRDELNDELFDILDAIGKGQSFVEIIWDTSGGQWQPGRLEWRDPRWFRPARADLSTPMLISEGGADVPLPGGKFIQHQVKAKSGLPVRSGLARIVTWAYLFKMFTGRDWAIFTQTYGQPLRLGKYHPQATDDDKDTLFRAVANIAGDCAAIIPAGMEIEFVQAPALTAIALYQERSDWLDRQVSKATLGQTTTTDAVSGGHAVSQEHRQVQEDIERADARALAAALNRDLVRPWVMLEYGPQEHYPRLVIARPDQEDLAQLTSSIGTFVPMGLRVSQSEIRSKLGLSEPGADEAVLGPPGAAAPAVAPAAATPAVALPAPRGDLQFAGGGDPGEAEAEAAAARNAEIAQDGVALAETALETIAALVRGIVMDPAVTDLEDVRTRLLTLMPGLSPRPLAAALRQAIVVAELAGRADLLD